MAIYNFKTENKISEKYQRIVGYLKGDFILELDYNRILDAIEGDLLYEEDGEVYFYNNLIIFKDMFIPAYSIESVEVSAFSGKDIFDADEGGNEPRAAIILNFTDGTAICFMIPSSRPKILANIVRSQLNGWLETSSSIERKKQDYREEGKDVSLAISANTTSLMKLLKNVD